MAFRSERQTSIYLRSVRIATRESIQVEAQIMFQSGDKGNEYL